MKRIPFPRRPIAHNFKRPHSKAEEPDCLFRRNPPSIMITTQSPVGGELHCSELTGLITRQLQKKQYRNRAGVLEKPCSGTFGS